MLTTIVEDLFRGAWSMERGAWLTFLVNVSRVREQGRRVFGKRVCDVQAVRALRGAVIVIDSLTAVMRDGLRRRYMDVASPRWTMLVSLTILVGTMVMSCLIVLWEDLSATFLFTLIMVLVVISGIFNAISQVSELSRGI